MTVSKLREGANTIKKLGLLDGSLYLIHRILTQISQGHILLHKYYLVAQPVPDKPWLPPRRGTTLKIRQIMPDDVVIKVFPRPESVISYRFQQGSICFVAFKGQEFIGFIWFTLGPYQEDEVRCRYQPLPVGKSAWDFDVYVQPEHRDGITFMKLWDETNLFLRNRGICWSLSRISAFNKGSLLSHAKMGIKRIGTATFFMIGQYQLTLSTLAPYVHISRKPDSYPIIALNPTSVTDEVSAS